MHVGISNLAWTAEEDDAIVRDLAALGCQCLEVAPTKLWSDPTSVARTELLAYRQKVERAGLRIVALQSLLYQQPQLRLFGSPQQREETIEFLTHIFDLAQALGARALVFGSPANRRRDALEPEAAMDIATEFFRAAGDRAAEREVCLCIEPLPTSLGCDFINNVGEARQLVERVDSAGFGLHLDSSSMHLNGEVPRTTIASVLPLVKHFHISEVRYGPFGSSGVDHAAFAAALRANGYEGVTSLEILGAPAGDNRQLVADAVRGAKATYEVEDKAAQVARGDRPAGV